VYRGPPEQGAPVERQPEERLRPVGRGLHSSTFWINVSKFYEIRWVVNRQYDCTPVSRLGGKGSVCSSLISICA
jgi:hypothetical protein